LEFPCRAQPGAAVSRYLLHTAQSAVWVFRLSSPTAAPQRKHQIPRLHRGFGGQVSTKSQTISKDHNPKFKMF